jgi:hypothetical protein
MSANPLHQRLATASKTWLKLMAEPYRPRQAITAISTCAQTQCNHSSCRPQPPPESQNTRLHELETARDDLTRKVAELQTLRDEADKALVDATMAGKEAKKEWEETVEALRQQIERLIEDRRSREREIEELKRTEIELRREMDEREKK